MSVTSTNERFQNRSSADNGEERTHVRVFISQTDDVDDGTATVLSDPSIPSIGEVHPTDLSARVDNKSCAPLDGQKYVFITTVNYSTQAGEENPLNEAPKISWALSSSSAPMFKDVNDKIVANSAGEPFEQDINRDISASTVNYSVNLATLDTNVFDYTNAVNSDQFTIDGVTIAQGWAKMKSISVGVQQEKNEIQYRTHTFSIEIDVNGWKVEALDIGYEELDINQERQPILNDEGLKIKRPWPLDGAGGAMPNADDDPDIIEFEPYEEKAFSVFNFA